MAPVRAEKGILALDWKNESHLTGSCYSQKCWLQKSMLKAKMKVFGASFPTNIPG